jgi:hypothetical protein
MSDIILKKDFIPEKLKLCGFQKENIRFCFYQRIDPSIVKSLKEFCPHEIRFHKK